jgi:ATP-binding cassette subfamily B protein
MVFFLKEKISRPKYNMGQNSWFMVQLAWTTGEKKVVVLSLLAALTAVSQSLINLYVSPSILSVVERRASASELIATILGFVLALMFVSAASAYVYINTPFGRLTVRMEIAALINRKAATTSYPNIWEEKFQKMLAKAYDSTYADWAETQEVWTTLTDLATNIIGFVFYLILMSSVQPFLLVVILATTVASDPADRLSRPPGE